ncbi:MAG: heavy metal translocating P-type ATPase [Peptococcaceae bacterium]|nr:heavy metal translocating P-type ATPase [Peptococcaceae bacterium]
MDEQQTVTDFDVTGMSCSACQAAVERAVKGCGAEDVSVNLLSGRMRVTHSDGLALSTIMDAVDAAGYHAEVHDANKARQVSAALSAEEQAKKRRILYSVILMIPLMLVAMLPMAPFMPKALMDNMLWLTLSPLVQLVLSVIILIINRAYFTSGFKALAQRHPNMDSLVAVGSGISLLYSIYTTIVIYMHLAGGNMMDAMEGLHQLYYDSAAMIVALITIGKYLEARAKRHTSDAISDLMALAPETAYLVEGDSVKPIHTADVVAGNILEVRPGGRIPVDGEIVSGSSSIDESAFSGESIPVEKGPGDAVSAGTINTTGAFRFRATAVGADTALSKIVSLVENANATKAPIARTADRVAAVFVPAILTLALITFGIWLIVGEPFPFAIKMGISVIVISCPCALGLATPVAIMVGSGQGAKKGVLFKDATALEQLHNIDTFVFDKTGTITEGHPSLTDIVPFQGQGEDALLHIAASLESHSEHPLAQAITLAADSRDMKPLEADDFRALSGMGVAATIGGNEYYAGNLSLMEKLGLDTRGADKKAEQLAREGKTPLYLADSKQLLGMLACADQIKADTPQAIATLHQMGKELIMLTGDHHTTAKAVAEKIALDDVISEVHPAEKEGVISDLKAKGKRVAMVGDGINDAPALARADVGIAIGAGTDIAIESGDVILTSSQLSDIAYAYELSAATIRNIHQNLFWAFFYNVLCIPLAAGGFYPAFGITLNPMIAAACMSLSSLFVVTNALRLRAWKPSIAPAAQPRAAETPQAAGPRQTIRVDIDGMSCNHCKMSVEKGLGALAGVESAEVSLDDHCATVVTTAAPESLPLEKTLTDLGFTYKGMEPLETSEEEKDMFGKKFHATVNVEGMSCNHCKMSVEKGLEGLDGVKKAVVSLDDKTAKITTSVDPSTLPIEKTINDLGFTFKGLEQ